MREARVHVAAEPGWDGHQRKDGVEPTRVVQPCGRCGIVLSSFDTANPPMYAVQPDDDPGKHLHAWWEVGAQVLRDPGYTDKHVTFKYVLPADELPDEKLCDHDEVPDDVDFYMATEDAA